MPDLLRTYLRLVLSEAARTPEDALIDELALLKRQKGDELHLVLYEPAELQRIITQRVVRLHDIAGQVTYDNLFRSLPRDHILGFISLGPPKIWDNKQASCWGASSIYMSAASEGYGPMMYDIALASAPGGTLAPDRFEVSRSARAVWDYYNTRRPDVKGKPFDDVWQPRTPPKEDDCQVHGYKSLDQAYSIDGGPDTVALEQAHRRARVSILKLIRQEDMDVDVDANDYDDELVQQALSYFSHRYEEG